MTAKPTQTKEIGEDGEACLCDRSEGEDEGLPMPGIALISQPSCDGTGVVGLETFITTS